MRIQKYFKLFETRTTELEEKEFIKIIRENCKDFLKYPKLLQRNKHKYTGKYSYINPKSFNRVPLNINNDLDISVYSKHHQLLMDNLPSWNGFPKRSNSIVGICDKSSQIIFGKHAYFVIPFDNAKFGVAPGEDLWACSLKNGNLSFDDFFSEKMVDEKIADNSYIDMIKSFSDSYKRWKSNNEQPSRSMLNNIFKDLYIKKDMELAISDYFSPTNFTSNGVDGFQILNYNELPVGDREFWTDSECVLVCIESEGGLNDTTTLFNNLLKSLI